MKQGLRVSMLMLAIFIVSVLTTEDWLPTPILKGSCVWEQVWILSGIFPTTEELTSIMERNDIQDFGKILAGEAVKVPAYLLGESYIIPHTKERWIAILIRSGIMGVTLLLGMILWRAYKHSMTHKYGRDWKSRRPHPIVVVQKALNNFTNEVFPFQDWGWLGRKKVMHYRERQKPLVRNPHYVGGMGFKL